METILVGVLVVISLWLIVELAVASHLRAIAEMDREVVRLLAEEWSPRLTRQR